MVNNGGGWAVGRVSSVSRRRAIDRFGLNPLLEGHAVNQGIAGNLLCEEGEYVDSSELLLGPSFHLKRIDTLQTPGEGRDAANFTPFAKEKRAFNCVKFVERRPRRANFSLSGLSSEP